MKVHCFEGDRSFGFTFTPETLEDALWMTRFELNAKKEIPFRSTVAEKDGFSQHMSFRRKIEPKSTIG